MKPKKLGEVMSVTGLNAGDILLINNRTKNRLYNIAGQKLMRRSSSVNYTHVALSLGDGIFIHADTARGVDLVFFPDLLDKSGGNWKVIRHMEITDEAEKKIKKAGIYHFGKAYSYRILMKENEKSLFCSQFVDLVYRSIGMSIFSREESKGLWHLNNALPVDFEGLTIDDKTWSDVTKIYSNELNDNSFELLKIHFTMQHSLILSERNMRKDHSTALDLLHALHDSHSLLPDENKNIDLENNLVGMIEDFNANGSDFFTISGT
ncbi:YiiX/YebB-like N1pC/P60 family cysteine hydrolase [Serratia marcescens]|uniref:YiiX/YebB-like N1pC/P60 family cysteine hydrolase n=1 Tax=Serratia marcescens TaxID=615 RepID=UPI0020C6F30C|nr:YiiX/YebB-like N1pC/P60 family cysteine hydrolase [Serratia marcescens]